MKGNQNYLLNLEVDVIKINGRMFNKQSEIAAHLHSILKTGHTVPENLCGRSLSQQHLDSESLRFCEIHCYLTLT